MQFPQGANSVHKDRAGGGGGGGGGGSGKLGLGVRILTLHFCKRLFPRLKSVTLPLLQGSPL
ncbi:hypothetical protein HanIR_Chr11g0542111 [Helianthus annuus]|nr:hypothetical protein HanIR_Chr11g0542111 [Helianthus annuus]